MAAMATTALRLPARAGLRPCAAQAARRQPAQPSAPRRQPSLRTRATAPQQPEGEGEGAAEQPSTSALVEQLMSSPENQETMQRVSDAAQRVAALQAESERLARAMADAAASEAAGAEAAERRGQEAAAALMAEAELKAKALLLQAAELEAQSAAAAKRKWQEDISEDAERIQSAKAAAAAALGGAAATLPLALSDGGGVLAALLSVGAAGVASALLGVTYRYAVRQDLANTQLKLGVVGAFGLARGLGQANGILAAGGGGADGVAGLDLSAAALGAAGLAMGQCMLATFFAATVLNVALQQGLVKPFGAAGGEEGGGQ